jgi:hypothetical protein
MWCHCYLRQGVVYLPTTGIVEKGFYRDVEPVAVIPVSNTDGLRRALGEMIARGNPTVPSLKPSEYPPPVNLKYAGVKTWNAFARNASLWSIEGKDATFRIYNYLRDTRGGWDEDQQNVEVFPTGANVDEVIERMIAILQETARLEAPKPKRS